MSLGVVPRAMQRGRQSVTEMVNTATDPDPGSSVQGVLGHPPHPWS
jgi:hypothetical protein